MRFGGLKGIVRPPTMLAALVTAGLFGIPSAVAVDLLPDVDHAPDTGLAGSEAESEEWCETDGDDGCAKWEAVYDDVDMNGPWPYDPDSNDPGEDNLHAMAVSPTGNRVFTWGLSTGVGAPRWAIVATDAATGDERWVVHRKATGNIATGEGGVVLEDIAVSADGRRVYATGSVSATERPGDAILRNTNGFTTAYRATTGEKLWERAVRAFPTDTRGSERYDLHSEDEAVASAVSPVGDRVYVTGYVDNRDTFHDVTVVAYDGVAGTQEWASSYDHAASGSPYPSDKALPRLAEVSPNGETLYVAGLSCNTESQLTARSQCDYLLLAYQAHDPGNPVGDGQQRWVRTIGSNPAGQQISVGQPASLEVAPDGSRVYMTGRGLDPDNSEAQVTAAYSAATGGLLWAMEYPDDERPVSMAASPTGEIVVVTGTIPSWPRGDFVTVAYDAATGEELWSAPFDNGREESDGARTVAVSPDGARVYVTGFSNARNDAGDRVKDVSGTGGTPIAGIVGWRVDQIEDNLEGSQVTIAYDSATGELLGIAHHGHLLAVEEGFVVEVGPDGTVFTAGEHEFSDDVDPLLRHNRTDWGIQAYVP